MVKKVGLIKGRHALPPDVTEYIYDGALPGERLTNDKWLTDYAENALKRIGATDEVMIYVTGLTQALIATLNACRALGIRVCLAHYDREGKSWWVQWVK